MNKLIFAGACVSLLITLAHVTHGGVQFHTPVLNGPMEADAKAVYSILWHFASLTMAVNTLALFRSAFRAGHDNVVSLVAIQYIFFAGLFIFYGMTRLGTIFELPQWTFFLAISGFSLFGIYRARLADARSS